MQNKKREDGFVAKGVVWKLQGTADLQDYKERHIVGQEPSLENIKW